MDTYIQQERPSPRGDDVTDHVYTIISADGHAGADLHDYRPYLASGWHDEFDSWAGQYTTGWKDLAEPGRERNWDSALRLSELASDGIVAEVLFPNTIPPFAPEWSVLASLPSAGDYERRWAGLQAHNRWLADFCAAAPQRRAGIAQILLNNVDDAVAEIRWTKSAGLRGGILLPGVPPNETAVAPLWSEAYEPIWRTCADLDVPINHHGGTGLPHFDSSPAGRAIMLVELPIYAHRGAWHLIFAGVLQRYPTLKVVLTEQGSGWIPGTMRSLDWFYNRMRLQDSPESRFGGEAARGLPLTPSEYFARNFYVGASFMRPPEAAVRDEIGVSRLMWGTDYPHLEGSTPYSREALRISFGGATPSECDRIFGATAAAVYDFDLDQLRSLGIGIDASDVHRPISRSEWPSDSGCGAFDQYAVLRAW